MQISRIGTLLSEISPKLRIFTLLVLRNEHEVQAQTLMVSMNQDQKCYRSRLG
jgi:hypothetical protein